MNSEFDECLKYGKIKPFAPTRGMVSKELSIARKDLVYAQASLQTGNYKWATIQAYYAMFHAARALLYSQGYREKSHYCLIVALRALFVDKALLSNTLVEAFQQAKSLRENADYEDNFSQAGAEVAIQGATGIIDVAAKLLA